MMGDSDLAWDSLQFFGDMWWAELSAAYDALADGRTGDYEKHRLEMKRLYRRCEIESSNYRDTL